MAKPYLIIENLIKVYNPHAPGEVKALSGLSFSLEKSEFAMIIGNNAAGKTTLFNIIAGKLLPSSGSIYLNGQNLLKLSEHQKAKIISYVGQKPEDNLITSMTLAENLAMAKLKSLQVGFRRGVKKEWRNEFESMLKPFNLGLEKRLDSNMNLLSGGQKQIVSLLMATITKPELLLLDEHTASLDPKISKIVMGITEQIIKDNKITVLMITHDLNQVLRFGSKLFLIKSGMIKFTAEGERKQNLTISDLVKLIEESV